VTSLTRRLSNEPCEVCDSSDEIISTGYIICKDCGTAKYRHYVDHLPVKYTQSKQIISHNFASNSLEYIGTLGSDIGISTGTIRSHKLSSKAAYKYRRLARFYHNRIRLDGSATHLRTMVAFTRICSKLAISSSLKRRSLYFYWEVVDREVTITNHILLVALCLLRTVREAGDRAPIRFSEIVTAFAENGHRVTNKNLLRLATELDFDLAPIRRTAEDYIERIAAELCAFPSILSRVARTGLQSNRYELHLIQVSLIFLNNLTRKDRGGVQPFPFAVSIVYLADRAISKVRGRRPILTQKLVGTALDAAEFTIRDHIYRFLGKLYEREEEDLIDFIKERLG